MESKPNILLITTDQQRYDCSGSTILPFLRTPHYDRLCREGIKFESAYADCPVCVPSRMSIMTGKYVFSHGMYTNGNSSEVIGREGTLPTIMRHLGYQTAAIGKMHFTPQRIRHGFDEMILPDDYYREMCFGGSFKPMMHGLGQNELYPAMATVPESMTLTSWIAEKCLDYIKFRRDPSMPFFLWCSFSKPHPPLDPPEPYYSMYRNCEIPEPAYGNWSEGDECPYAFRMLQQQFSFDLITKEIIREARSAYYGLITQIDYNMGRIFAALDSTYSFDNTLIIYTSDHGEYLGDHHCGGKGFFHEAAAHIPFVIRLPKTWQERYPGKVISNPVTLADILPTLVSIGGGYGNYETDGQNLISLIKGEIQKPREFVVSGYDWPLEESLPATFGITDGKWKYIKFSDDGKEQLFDLAEDPNEKTDLSKDTRFEAKKCDMKGALLDFLKPRCQQLYEGGKLLRREHVEEDESVLRSKGWLGFVTEYDGIDIRH